MAIPQNEYLTKNLFVATFLIAAGKVKFMGLKSLDQKTKLFRFSPKEKAEELEIAYFSGAKLPVKTVFAEYNTLKDMLFQRESNGESSYDRNY
jgi:hypothetical protein